MDFSELSEYASADGYNSSMSTFGGNSDSRRSSSAMLFLPSPGGDTCEYSSPGDRLDSTVDSDTSCADSLKSRDSSIDDSASPGCVRSPQCNSEEGDRESASVRRPGLNRLSQEQVQTLKDSFEKDSRLNRKRKQELSSRLGLHPRQIEVWYQNKRAKIRVKGTHQQYETLRQTYESQKAAVRQLQQSNLELQDQLLKIQNAQAALNRTQSANERAHNDQSHHQQTQHMTDMNVETSELVMARADGTFCRPSAGLEELLGYSEAELRRMDVQSITFPEDRTSDVIEQVLSGMVLKVMMRLRLRARNGSAVWAQMNAYSLCDSKGDIYFVAYIKKLADLDGQHHIAS
mmetsp:Transcript_39550/g.64137  ORF Transcript_39550/g.64137 Transcript_39550/m.64137 type:complete len:346 (+) Transcript_39550:409-1446(+)